MGGDFAPDEIIKGAYEGAQNYNLNLILTGNKNTIVGSAERMGIKNARFINYEADTKMPFEDNTFDGIMFLDSASDRPFH